MGGAWMPVFNEAAASKAGEVFWPVAIRNHELCSIMCPKQQPYPSVSVCLYGWQVYKSYCQLRVLDTSAKGRNITCSRQIQF